MLEELFAVFGGWQKHS